MKKEIIISFVAGAVLMAVGYLGVVFYKSIRLVNAHEVVLQQVVNIINEAQKNAQPQQPVSQPPIQ